MFVILRGLVQEVLYEMHLQQKQNKTKQKKHSSPQTENQKAKNPSSQTLSSSSAYVESRDPILRSIIIEQWPRGAELHTQQYSGYHRKVSVKVGQLDCGDWMV